MNEWIVTAASAGVVAFMVAVAALLGFRQTTRLDDGALARLAANEGDHSEAAIIAPNGRAAFARLRSGKLMVASAMGALLVSTCVGLMSASPTRNMEIGLA